MHTIAMLPLLTQLDITSLLFIQNNLRQELLTPFWLFLTHGGSCIFILFLLILVFRKKSAAHAVVMTALLGAGFGAAAKEFLKTLFLRPRPFELFPSVIPLTPAGGFSFPSGHTTISFAVAFVLYHLLPKRFGVPMLFLAGLISFSRLYLGVHYPSDVLGGIFLGYIASLAAEKVMKAVTAFFHRMNERTASCAVSDIKHKTDAQEK